jgi:hypothetical protein
VHFGFEPSPAQLNDRGKALLVNAVVYISRFTEDWPIPRTPSPFEGTAFASRSAADSLLGRADLKPEYLDFYFSRSARAAGGKDPGSFRKWYRANRDFLHAEPSTGKLTLDEEAKALGAPPGTREFFTRAFAALRGGGESAARARRLLARYAPEGPGAKAGAGAWKDWWEAHRDYLFFSDSGAYRWYVDPLAKKRKVPSAKLHGPARATTR